MNCAISRESVSGEQETESTGDRGRGVDPAGRDHGTVGVQVCGVLGGVVQNSQDATGSPGPADPGELRAGSRAGLPGVHALEKHAARSTVFGEGLPVRTEGGGRGPGDHPDRSVPSAYVDAQEMPRLLLQKYLRLKSRGETVD